MVPLRFLDHLAHSTEAGRPGKRVRWTRAGTALTFRRWITDENGGEVPALMWWRENRPPGQPSVTVLCELYGSWNGAVRTAGFEPRDRGGEWSRMDEESFIAQTRIDHGETLSDVAADLGITGQALGRRLRRYRERHPEVEHAVPYMGWRKKRPKTLV